MSFGFLLTGIGVALLGPILPLLTRQWALSDARSGLLPVAEFLGIFLGSLTILRRPRLSFFWGSVAAAAGFLLFSTPQNWILLCAGLFAGCWGLGQIITSTNLIAGDRFAATRGVALTSLNFLWSLGAILSPLLASWLSPFIAVSRLLAGFAVLFALVVVAHLMEWRRTPTATPQNELRQSSTFRLPLQVFIYFAAFFILYGAFEGSISFWITTYMLRYGAQSLAVSQSATTVFWVALTAARGITSLLLLRIGEKIILRTALGTLACATAGLILSHSATSIFLWTGLLGFAAGPVFPINCSHLLHNTPTPREAGLIMALTSLGAALLPWIVGAASQHLGSLQLAFVLPLIAACTMFLLSSKNVGGQTI
jgi:fucose permease